MKKVAIGIVLLIVSLGAYAQKEKLQVAYIYQFTKYIDWCSGLKSGDFVIGILGDSPVYAEMQVLQSKKVVDQTIVVKKFASLGDIGRCNILFITKSSSGLLSGAKGKVSGNCTLIITESPGLVQSGAGINMIEQSGKIVFEINKTLLTSQGLSINTQLINLAKVVY